MRSRGARPGRGAEPGRTLSRRTWVLGAACGLLACGARRGPVPPRMPPRRVPADLIPGDLDVVVRVDLAAVRSALGAAMPTDLAAPVGAAGDPGVRTLVAAATAGATTGWLAFRPAPEPGVLDHVLVLRGRFSRLDPRAGAGGQGWSPPRDLGDGWRRHDALRPVERTGPARVYLRDDSVVALVTPAEIDAVERTLERGIAPELRLAPLLPPTHGTLAVRARSRSIAGWVDPFEPAAAGLLRAAQRLTVVLDLEAARLRGEADLRFGAGTAPGSETVAAATATAEHLERLRQALASAPGAAGEVARGVTVAAEGPSVHLRLECDRAVLAALLVELGALSDAPAVEPAAP